MPTRAGGGGGTQTTSSGPKYQQYPKGTKWAYFKKLPPGITTGNGHSNGWVRVGSVNWHKIVAYNTGSHHEGGVHGGNLPNTRYHPSRKATQQWNPSSPRGQIILNNGSTSSDGKRNPGADSGRGGEQGAKHSGTATPVTAGQGLHPGDKPPKDKTPPAKDPNFSKFIGNPNTGSREKMSDAQTMAGLQYDAQITDARQQLANQQAQGAQDLKDIGNWYTQIQQQLAGGQARGAAAANQAAGVTGNVTQSLLAAIGGASNQSAGAVAAQGAGQQADLRQQALLQQQFATNMGAAQSAQQAGQMSAQQALNSQAQQALGAQIRDLLGQRGQAVTQNQQTIRAFNNSVGNQQYANRLSKLEAIVGAKTALGGQKLQALQLTQARNNGAAGGFKKFALQSPAEKFATIKMLVAGGPSSSGGLVPIGTALQRAKAAGYDPHTVAPYLSTFYTQQ